MWGTSHPDVARGYPIPRQGVPHPRMGVPDLAGGGSPSQDGRYDGVPPGKDMVLVEVLWDGDGVHPRKDMRPMEVLWDGDGVPTRV